MPKRARAFRKLPVPAVVGKLEALTIECIDHVHKLATFYTLEALWAGDIDCTPEATQDYYLRAERIFWSVLYDSIPLAEVSDA